MSQIALQLHTVRETYSNASEFAETLKRVSDIGYRAVEPARFRNMEIDEAVDVLRASGLEVVCGHSQWPRFLGELDQVIDEFKRLGARHTAIGALPPEYRSLEGARRFAQELVPVAERLGKEGMDFNLHNHNFEFCHFEGKAWLDWILELTTPDQLKIELDTHWVQAGGADPAAWVRKLKGRLALLHCKDMVVSPEREQRHEAVGLGNMNFPAILEAAAEVGVEWYIVEQDQTYGRDPFDCVRDSYNYLRSMGLE